MRYGRTDAVRRAARDVAAFVTQLGEAFCGTGHEAAHVNTVLGAKGGPVETAWATALATPREGHVAFVVAAQPGLAVKPMTLFVNKATIASDEHAALTWGPAQAGVASGVLDAVADGTVPAGVDRRPRAHRGGVARRPRRVDADAVYAFNREATHASLRSGALSLAHGSATSLAVRDEPFNGYWLPPSMRPGVRRTPEPRGPCRVARRRVRRSWRAPPRRPSASRASPAIVARLCGPVRPRPSRACRGA